MTSETNSDQKGSEEVKTVNMAFADQHELDPNMEEGDYLEEPVQAVQVGPNQWRLEQNPMFTEMAGYKDTVEGKFDEHGVLLVNRVIEKSGLRTIRTGVPRMFYFSDFGKAYLDRVMEAGGMWEITFWGILVVNLPDSQAEELEELFHTACREAEILGRTEKKKPGRLYRERPQGGVAEEERKN